MASTPYKKGGGRQCAVVNCSNNQKKLHEWENTECKHHEGLKGKDCPCLAPFKFHCIPVSGENRLQWIKSINRKDFNPPPKTVVCSTHFLEGRPTKQNPSPVLNMGYEPTTPKLPGRRPLKRKCLNEIIDSRKTKSSKETESPIFSEKSDTQETEYFTAVPANFSEDHILPQQCNSMCCFNYPEHCNNSKPKVLVDAYTQTIDVVALDHNYGYKAKTRNASTQHSPPDFSIDDIKTDIDAQFYTGLSYYVLFNLISSLAIYGKNLPYKMNIPDQILTVLLRLRLVLTFEDIGRRFGVSHQLISNIFQSWINIMCKRMSDCVIWLPRETIRRNLPKSFKTSFPKTTCIIDCSEIFIQRPFSLKARAQTWSTYKGNNTAKFLVAITPNGFIMFVSQLYGGRASDNFITKHCGFLNHLLPGDEVMADRGFTIGEDLCSRRVKLNIPAFMKGRTQLSEQETIDSRRIAAERIHVERAIMRMKSFRILNTKYCNKSIANANKTLRVIAALCNMKDSLIKEKIIE